MFEELKKLTLLDGPSGFEEKVRNYLKEKVGKYLQTKIDRIENLTASNENKGKPKILVTAHMDEIGFIIQHITEEGFIKFTNIGGWDSRIILGMPVKILGNKEIVGIIGTVPPHILKEEEIQKPIKIEDAYIDTGLTKKELNDLGVDVGTYIVPYSNFIVNKNKIFTKALDDRVGCYILSEIAKIVKEIENEVILAFTVQEEIGCRGAKVVAFEQNPDIAIVVECTVAGDVPYVEEYRQPTKLNEGVAITLIDKTLVSTKKLFDFAIKIAKEKEIKYQIKKPIFGATDAGSIYISRKGIPSLVISCPARYVHSSYSLTTTENIENTKNLLIEILNNIKKLK